MGSSASQEDERHLLEDDEEIQPIFEELKLVLIGSQGAGKSTIANAILKKKVFTFWTSYRRDYVKETRTVSGTQIHLTRTPGWRGDLCRSEPTKLEIVHCVQSLYSSGPHAILLVLNVNSVLSKSNIDTLESLLTVQLWKHTIVLFTHGEKLGHCSIEDHIISKELKPLIDKCGKRYFLICKNDSYQIIEKIEEHIVRKNSTSCFKLTAQAEVNNTLLEISDRKYLVERIKYKITSILTYKEKLKKEQNKDLMKKLLDSKDVEIRRLEEIVEEKEREIEMLQTRDSRTPDLDLPVLRRRIAELEDQLKGKNSENEILKKRENEKDAEIKQLKRESQMRQQKARDWGTHEDQNATVHAGYRSELCQDVSVAATKSQNKIQLQELPSKGSAPHSWHETLLKVLEKLTQDELKRMIFYICCDDKYGIPMSLLEGKDRVDLAYIMLTQWDKQHSVLNTRELIKKIPHIDDDMRDLIEPYLMSIHETW